MKYNIFTVLNEPYAAFGKMLVSSIFDKVDLDKVNRIIIANTGISEDTENFLLQFPKVETMATGMQTGHTRIHDQDWKKNVFSKAKLMLEAIRQEEEFVPTVLIDSDCVIVQDFSDLLEGDFDIAPCLRNQAGRGAGHTATSTHIGSFFYAATEKSIPFIEKWVELIPRIEGTSAKESPALSYMCDKMSEEVKIKDICERTIANIELAPPPLARVYHLKSDAHCLTIPSRLKQNRTIYYLNRYLNGYDGDV